MTDVRLNRYST